ncbi:uncharacterized protein LOC126567660 [Anopheles maculipalpis]|uniref:uncharacterized protein LOC126567660 n=1 Tax=Anopheles maculipalpis TaxID=1496333 RepID=UPI002159019F|nr:uncharacterized protein LOC126567660 [Anopheles maculipalpis]
MDFTYSYDRVLNIEPKVGEKFPELSIMRRNRTEKNFLDKFYKYKRNVTELAKKRCLEAFAKMQDNGNKRLLREGSSMIRDIVYCSGHRMLIKRYLNNYGRGLLNAGRTRVATRFLEAAYAIDMETTAEYVQTEIARLICVAYKNMGQYQAEMSVLCWEKDLFGTNDSKAVSCETLDGKLVARRDFNVGEVVFIDKPLVGHVKVSRVQCNCCLLKTMNTIPCVRCCTVFYCSVACIRKDYYYHKYECTGYKIALFPFFEDDTLVLRLLVNVMDILKRNVSQHQQQQQKLPKMTARQLWNILLEKHEYSEDFIKVFQACTCDHFAEDNDTYQVLLQNASFMLYYIDLDKRLVDDYTVSWMNFDERWPYLFLESVLLRLLCITKLNVCKFRYRLQFNSAEMDVPDSKDDKFTTCEQFKIVDNEYRGMYSFQTEMDGSTTAFNTIFNLLDHGAVAVRAVNLIKKGDAIVFKIESSIPPTNIDRTEDDQSIYSPLKTRITSASNIIEKTDLMMEKVASLVDEGCLYTEENFHALLNLFDCFIDTYRKVVEEPIAMVVLYDILNVLQAVYQTARSIPDVLMHDVWKSLLVTRGFQFRRIRQDYIERLGNHLHKMYYQN